ncbi:MAG: DNA-directed DNA polymerase II small subunit [Candidatus Woesearchaeota archaeon]
MNEEEKKQKIKEIVRRLAEQGLLASPELIEQELSRAGSPDEGFLSKKIEDSARREMLVLDKTSVQIASRGRDVNWTELERVKAAKEMGKESRAYESFVKMAESAPSEQEQQADSCRVIVENFEVENRSRTVQDFVDYFNARYAMLESMLRSRQELTNIVSISRISKKRDREEVSLIGMVFDKSVTKNGNIILTLEDTTGRINVLFNKGKKELYQAAKDTVLDEVVGINGVTSDNIVFANALIRPDIPVIEKKSSPEEGYAVFLSDLHVGSKKFLLEEFNKFLEWINGNAGNPSQREIASKVKYIFIVGDLIDGVGIYAEQDKDLTTKDVKEQYDECAALLSKIPKHIKLIISPGNHDAMRIAEPQPKLYDDFAESIWKLPNAILVTNPALVNIDSSENFSGFNVLIYHGYSFDYYVSEVESIRAKGGYDKADLIMKFLLERRHLAPATSSTLFIPETTKDPLVISKIPDIFVTGHIHKCSASIYKNIVLIGGSCWQAKTEFQERVGHHPLPARVPIMNLKTREIKILNFEKQQKEEKVDGRAEQERSQ